MATDLFFILLCAKIHVRFRAKYTDIEGKYTESLNM